MSHSRDDAWNMPREQPNEPNEARPLSVIAPEHARDCAPPALVDSPLGLPVEGTAQPEQSALEAAWAEADRLDVAHWESLAAIDRARRTADEAWRNLCTARIVARKLGPRPAKATS